MLSTPQRWEPPANSGQFKSFNGKFRDECLSQHWFLSLPDARFHLERYRRDYNEVRPHSALDNKTPGEFAREHGVSVASPHPPRLSQRVA